LLHSHSDKTKPQRQQKIPYEFQIQNENGPKSTFNCPESLQKTTRNDDRNEKDTKIDLCFAFKPAKIQHVTKTVTKIV